MALRPCPEITTIVTDPETTPTPRLEAHSMHARAAQFDAARWSEARQPRSTVADTFPYTVTANCGGCSGGNSACCGCGTGCKPGRLEGPIAKLLCS